MKRCSKSAVTVQPGSDLQKRTERQFSLTGRDGVRAFTNFVNPWFMGHTVKYIISVCRPGFIIDQYGWKSELSDNVWYKSPISNSSSICGLVCGIHGKVRLLPYLQYALSCIDMAEMRLFPTRLRKIFPSIYGSTALLLGLGRVYSFLIFFTVGRTPWTGDQPVARPLPVHRTAQTQNKRTQTSMSQVVFEPMIPVFQRGKTFHALYCTATVVGLGRFSHVLF
jgi:hypothetical protein